MFADRSGVIFNVPRNVSVDIHQTNVHGRHLRPSITTTKPVSYGGKVGPLRIECA